MIDIIDVLGKYGIKEDDVVILIPHGSRTYGRFRDDSDWDFVCVIRGDKSPDMIKHENVDINVWTEKEFDDKIAEHDIQTLENLFCPISIKGGDLLKKRRDEFIEKGIDRVKLRTSISRTSSRGVSYAKTLWGYNDFHRSKKNICHAYRFTLFGLQLIEYNKIHDYGCANTFADRLDKTNDGGDYKETLGEFLAECKRVSKQLNELCPMNKQKKTREILYSQ
jgi:predicted nucleotidyltransferase